MLSDSDFIELLEKKCIQSDNINGKIKFHFIVNILDKMDIINKDSLSQKNEIILSELFEKDIFVPLSSIVPRYNNEYKEYKEIGKGAFGSVFKVKHYLDNNFYAIKKILVPFHKSNEIHNAVTEILILSRLQHPNIVRYYNSWIEPFSINYNQNSNQDCLLENGIIYTDSQIKQIENGLEDNCSDSIKEIENTYYSDDNLKEIEFLSDSDEHIENKEKGNNILFYIQMELCNKSTLEDILNKNEDIDIKNKINILKQIISATKYLHDNNIIHRDIKPKNILFSKENHIKLSDFGLSVFNNNINLLNSSKGTFLYKDPFSENKYMDIYSIGVIITEMFSNFNTQMERIKVLSELRNNNVPQYLPLFLQNVIKFCICSNLNERYDIEQLQNVINKKPYKYTKNKGNY